MITIDDTHTERHLATIQTIEKLKPMANSDFLEIANMVGLGWNVVVKKGEFKPGDRVIYFEVDSAINVQELDLCLSFLKEKSLRKFFNGHTPESSPICEEWVRVKILKLRGQVSEGLIIPVHYNETRPNGTDVSESWHVHHIDDVIDKFRSISILGSSPHLHINGDFPSYVPKTDEIRIQNLVNYFEKYRHDEFEITEKNDGSSCTIIYAPDYDSKTPFKVCTRRYIINEDDSAKLWFNAFPINLKEHLELYYNETHHSIAIQGEMVGPKFNANRDAYLQTEFHVFRIYDITLRRFLTPPERYAICSRFELKHVKVFESAYKIFEKFNNIDDLVEFVKGKTDRGHEREGMVFKKIDDGFVSFKVINPNYLLKCEK